MSAQPILIVGSMAFDDLEFPFSVPNPSDPKVSQKKFTDVVGGSATYASFTAGLYGPVRAVAVVGDDFPEETLTRLSKRGVSTEGIQRVTGKTFRWSGRYHADMVNRDTLDTQLNVFADFRPKLPETYVDSPIVLLGNIHPTLQLEVLDQVKSPKLVVADTMNFWIEGTPEPLAAVLKRVDVLVINDEEARLLSGEHNIRKAARAVMSQGPKTLVIKRGEYGALLFQGERCFVSPALILEDVADPTGAGDSFAGGFVGHLASAGHSDFGHYVRAMLHGTATASFCVQGVGASQIQDLELTRVQQRVGHVRQLCAVID